MRHKDRELQYQERRDTKEETPKIKTNIKMAVNPEQSRKIQEICFANNIGWGKENEKNIQNISKRYLFIDHNEWRIEYSSDMETFVKDDFIEINPYLFIRTNGTCIENPNEHLDRLDDIVDEAIKEVSKEDSHNAHYKAQKIDTIARCKANMTLEQQKAICIFNCDKYIHRSKGQDLEDIQKVRYYLNWLEDIEKQLKDKK